jgi:hypothetical protein
LTTPAPPQQPPPVQPPPQQPPGLDNPALAIAVASVLAGVGGPAVTVAATIAALKVRFALSHAAGAALGAVLAQVMAHPPPVTGVIGAASAQTSRMNAARRAQYVLAAAKRVTVAARDARSKGEPVTAAVRGQLAQEQRFYAQHQQAMWNRATAAGMIDMEAATHGRLLGWYAHANDGRVTPGCLAADGHNFYVDDPPDIGLPGIGPHVGCRCRAGPPWPGAPLLPSRGARYARAAA